MPSASSAKAADAFGASFNAAFESRFKDLQDLFNTPSTGASNRSDDSAANFVDTCASTNAAPPDDITPASNCMQCAALGDPLLSGPNKPRGNWMVWILVVVLLLAVLGVIFGLYKVFLKSSEARSGGFASVIQQRVFGAPHVVAPRQDFDTKQTRPEKEAVSLSSAHVLDVTEPHGIFPTPAHGLTFVFFHAKWCGHCKRFRPVYELIAERFAGRAKFWAVSADVLELHPEQAQLGIQGYPTVHVYLNGARKTDPLVGSVDTAAFHAFVSKHA